MAACPRACLAVSLRAGFLADLRTICSPLSSALLLLTRQVFVRIPVKNFRRLHCHALSSAAYAAREKLACMFPGKMVFTVLGGVAELERSIIRERVIAGQRAAKRRGVKFGRPVVAVDSSHVLKLRQDGMSWRAIAAQTGIAKDRLRRAMQPSA